MRGQSMMEVIIGCFAIIPIVLFLFDAIVLVLAQTANDSLAKEAARAAASQADNPVLQAQAVRNVLGKFPRSGFIPAQPSANVTFDAVPHNNLIVTTTLVVKLPVPVPFVNLPNPTFSAKAVEPIVAKLSQ
jgi:hypothetical protein